MAIIGIIVYLIIFMGPPIIGLVLSIVGMKKQKSGINEAGIVLNTIALSIQIIRVFVTLIKYAY